MSVQGPSASQPRFPELRPERVAQARSQSAAPATSTASRDHSLWDVLTDEERTFFSQQSALGTLSYGKPRGAEAPSAPTGQRLDVRA